MSKRINGLYLNCDPVDQPEGFYRSAKNIVLDESIGAVVNESGTTLEDSLPDGNIVIGTQLLNDESVIIFSVTESSENSEIAIFTSGEYQTIINNPSLNFHIEHSIQSDFSINDKNERVVYWTDGYNQPRWLNIDNPTDDINYTSLFPYTNTSPRLSVKSINPGQGDLSNGVYYFAVAYLDNDTNDIISDFYNITGPISVRPAFENTGSSSITFTLSGIDPNYRRIQVAVVKKIDNIIDEVDLLPELPSNITEYTYTGGEGVTPGSLAEIQINKAFYPLAQTLHINDDTLYMGNLESGKDIGYQPYANNIKVRLVEEQPPNTVVDGNTWRPSSLINNVYYKGYFKGETYAFYISWLLKEGGESKAYHIPGRKINEGEGDIITTEETSATANLTVVSNPSSGVSGTTVTLFYKGVSLNITVDEFDDSPTLVAESIESVVNNSSSIQFTADRSGANLTFIEKSKGAISNGQPINISLSNASDWENHPFNDLQSVTMSGGLDESTTKQFHYESTYDSEYHMGYWENENETYPNTSDWVGVNGGEDLRGKKVRHHSIPDVKHLSGIYKYSRPVGIKLTNVNIPIELEGKVNGYKVYYAKHDEQNRKTLDQGILINSLLVDGSNNNEGDLTDEDVYIPNNVNINRSSPYKVDNHTHYSHPFTLLRKRSSIESLNHIHILDTTDTFSSLEKEINPPWEDSGSHAHLFKTVVHSVSPNSPEYSGTRNIPVTAKSYIDASSTRNRIELKNFGFPYNMNNYSGESKLLIRTSEALDDRYYLVNFRTLKKNLYNPFDKQILVHTGYVHTNMSNLNSGNIYGGDAFTNLLYGFKANRTPKDVTEIGVHILNQLQSYDNLNLRTFGNNPWETYFPKVDPARLSAIYFSEDGSPVYTVKDDFDIKEVDNWYGYDEGESSVNDLKFPEIYPKNQVEDRVYPTRVARNSNNFRIFLQDDYIDLSKKRGELVKLTTYNNILIPHMQRALVRTRGQEELQVDEISAFLGTGNIFGVKPEEIIYTEDGFAGLLDKTHSKSTPYGYFFYDLYSNRVYVLNNEGLRDITEPILPIFKDFNIDDFILNAPTNFNFEIINE